MANVIDLTVSSDSDSEVEDHDLTGDLDVELGHSDSDVEGHDSDVEGHDSDVEGHDSDVEDHDSTGVTADRVRPRIVSAPDPIC